MSNPLFSNLPNSGAEENSVGSLERLGIPVETQIDENVLSPGAAKSVKFRVSRPEGYSFQEVEEFVLNILAPSIEWYAQTIYQRDRAVHTLGGELDKANTDIQNLRAQVQYAEMNSNIKQGIDRNADDREAIALMDSLNAANAEVARLTTQLATGGGNQNTTDSTEEIDALNAQILELNQYIETVTEQYNQLYAQYEELAANSQAVTSSSNTTGEGTDEQIVTLNAQILELNQYIETVTEQYNQLYAQYEELAANGVSPSQAIEPDLSNYVAVSVYQELQGVNAGLLEEINSLRAQLATVTGEVIEPDEEIDDKRRPLLASEERDRAVKVDLSKFVDLPPGIRPEDLV